MRRLDYAVAVSFLALGLYLLAAAFTYPAGMGRLPGPGFFPAIVGAVIFLLALGLLFTARRQESSAAPAGGDARTLVVTVLLLGGYLGLWGIIPFFVRTALFVTVFLRLVGERWPRAIAVALLLTAAVVAAFQYGLRVSLG